MRKFALLFAFVLVLSCAGGAFAWDLSIDLKELRDTASINIIKSISGDVTLGAQSDTLKIKNASSGKKQMDPDDYKFIRDTLKQAASFDINEHVFELRLDTEQTAIPAGAFKGYAGKLNVSADFVEKIDDSAFEGVKGLKLIGVLNSSVFEEIGANAFKDVTFNFDTNPGNISINSSSFEAMGEGAFAGSNITSMDFTSVKVNRFNTIPKNAFKDCAALTDVVFTAATGLTTIDEGAFKRTSLTSVTLPTAIETIGKEAFANCYGLTAAAFTGTDKLTTIGEGAFRLCVALTSAGALDLSDAKALTTIGDYAFAETKVTSMDFPTALKNIGKGAFNSEGKSGNLRVTFRKDAGATETQLTTASDVATFLAALNIAGAFSDPGWPENRLDSDSFKIGYSGDTSGESLYTILNKAIASGGIDDNSGNATTISIVKAFSGAGFGDAQILKILSKADGTAPVLSQETITAITRNVTPTPPTKSRLLNDIEVAEKLLADTSTSDVPGSGKKYTTQAEKDTLQAAIDAARTVHDNPLVLDTDTAAITAAINALNSAVTAFKTTLKDSTGGGSGSTGYGGSGSTGGCAAGFAPIAALFVLGALKLRKGR